MHLDSCQRLRIQLTVSIIRRPLPYHVDVSETSMKRCVLKWRDSVVSGVPMFTAMGIYSEMEDITLRFKSLCWSEFLHRTRRRTLLIPSYLYLPFTPLTDFDVLEALLSTILATGSGCTENMIRSCSLLSSGIVSPVSAICAVLSPPNLLV